MERRRALDRVSIGAIDVARPVALTRTGTFTVEGRPPGVAQAMGPFPARLVAGWKAARVAPGLLERDPVTARRVAALDRPWPQPITPRAMALERRPGAIAIEHLLTWTYRNQRAHTSLMGDDELMQLRHAGRDSGTGRSLCGCAAIAERADLGVDRVDGGGYRLNRVHPDAETVHERVDRLSVAARRLIIRHALADTTPPWSSHRCRLVPVLNGKGLPKVVRTKHDQPWYCPIEWDVPPERVLAANTDYALWHGALIRLFMDLRAPGLLTQHAVGAPLAPAAPWEE